MAWVRDKVDIPIIADENCIRLYDVPILGKAYDGINSKGENEKVQVLDAGCGFGQYSYFMAKKFKNSIVLGIDINERRIKDCLKFSESEGIENLKFDVANLENLNYSIICLS